VEIVHTRLSSLADNIVFDHDRSIVPGLSVLLIRNIFETGAGPLKKWWRHFHSNLQNQMH
jgi:hypothetical protein